MATYSYTTKALLFAFCVLNALDWWFTRKILVANPLAFEANPIAAGILQQSGYVGLAIFKIGATVVVCACVGMLSSRAPRQAVAVSAFGVGVLAFVVVRSWACL